MHRVLEWFTDRLVSLASLFLLVMMLHVCADVALKYLMSRPIEGTLEIVSYYYMVAAVFLPLAFVELTRSAVAVDLFFIMMPRAMKIACMGLVLLTMFTVPVLYCFAEEVKLKARIGEYRDLPVASGA